MSWNYRVVKVDGVLAIHEVYDLGGQLFYTDAVPVMCNDNEDLNETYRMMGEALKLPIMTPEDFE